MKKPILLLILCLIILGCGAIYDKYFETVTDYILVKYTPSQRQESPYTGVSYSDPKFEYEMVGPYTSDEEAVKQQTAEAKHRYSCFEEKYREEQKNPSQGDAYLQHIFMETYLAKMDERRFLIRATHPRKYTQAETLQLALDAWADQTLEEPANTSKIDIKVYPLETKP